MKALVTGGGGFLGLYVVEQLLDVGADVRVICRKRYERLDQLGVEWVQGDIQDADIVESACDGVDAVFHVAAVPGIWGPWKMFHGINTVGTENVIAGCRNKIIVPVQGVVPVGSRASAVPRNGGKQATIFQLFRSFCTVSVFSAVCFVPAASK